MNGRAAARAKPMSIRVGIVMQDTLIYAKAGVGVAHTSDRFGRLDKAHTA
jgi:hypothetical protein